MHAASLTSSAVPLPPSPSQCGCHISIAPYNPGWLDNLSHLHCKQPTYGVWSVICLTIWKTIRDSTVRSWSTTWSPASLRKYVSASPSFPMDLDVRMKATLIGAMFLIDFMFFEKKGNQEQDDIGMFWAIHPSKCYPMSIDPSTIPYKMPAKFSEILSPLVLSRIRWLQNFQNFSSPPPDSQYPYHIEWHNLWPICLFF